MSQDEIARARGRRLYQLKILQARMGPDLPPHQEIEIDELEAAGVTPLAEDDVRGDLPAMLAALARHADRGLVAALITSVAALALAVADFVLILALR